MPSMSGIDCTEVSVSSYPALPRGRTESAAARDRAWALCADTAGTDYFAVLPNVTAASRAACIALSALFSMFGQVRKPLDNRDGDALDVELSDVIRGIAR
jgi:hypothetical protein